MNHEHREMSEHRETIRAAMDQAIPCLAGDIASGRVEATRSLFPKNSQREFFGNKEKRSTMLPQAKTAFILSNVQFERPPHNACN
ncbi:MAG: hypothetical protein ACLFVO_25860 [Chloroflexaceae bacterium]